MDPADLLRRLDDVLDLLGPRACAGCRGPRGPLCPRCAPLLAGPAYDAPVRPRPRDLPRVLAVAAYEGPVREAVVAFKDHGRWALRPVLGVPLARSVAAAVEADGDLRALVLVPVPGSPGSARERDGDHVRELATTAARELRRLGAGAVVAPGLESVRRRRDQVGLGRAERATNLAGSMAATPAARRLVDRVCTVVLVDDVVTTGATLAEGARALTAAGVRVHAAAVVAATTRTAAPTGAHR